jgi:hypothetical protein
VRVQARAAVQALLLRRGELVRAQRRLRARVGGLVVQRRAACAAVVERGAARVAEALAEGADRRQLDLAAGVGVVLELRGLRRAEVGGRAAAFVGGELRVDGGGGGGHAACGVIDVGRAVDRRT